MRRNYGWFRLAKELGMGLEECMDKHTEDQMAMWNFWYEEEANKPGKVESYIMRLTVEVRMLNERVRTIFGGKMVEPNLEDFRLTFQVPGDKPDAPVLTPEESAGRARAVWTAHLGMEVVEKRMPRAKGEEAARRTKEEYESWRARWN